MIDDGKPPVVGPDAALIVGPAVTGVYVGPNPDLRGRRALVARTAVRTVVVAQFDDLDTGHSLGWWSFASSAFRVLA